MRWLERFDLICGEWPTVQEVLPDLAYWAISRATVSPEAMCDCLDFQNERPRTMLNMNGFVAGPLTGLLKRKIKSPSTK
jgi:hypothetical protein